MNEVVASNDTALMSFIERAAKDPEFDVAKFGELLRLQRDVGHDLARRSFNRAMAAAQSEMMPVIRSAQNKHLGNKYAKLEDIDREMRPIYTRHGFSVRFGSAPAPREGDMRITCTVAHEDGYFEENYLDAPASMLGSQGGRMAVTPVQAVGSVVTYLRRYLSTMVFNVVLADDDDDGEGTRRAAAAAATRGERKVAPAIEVYATNKPQSELARVLTPEQLAGVEAWIAEFQVKLDRCQTRAELDLVVTRPAVTNNLEHGPEALKREINAMIAAAYDRLPAVPRETPDDLEIAGEAYLAAG